VTRFLLILLGFFILFLAFAQNKKWINLANKNKPSTGSVLGIFDELFSPSRHQANVQIQEQKELKVEVSNSDPNVIHIEISEK